MLKTAIILVMLGWTTAALAEEMDDVLKTSNTVSEQALDETAEKLVAEQEAFAAAAETKAKAAEAPKAVAEKKALSEAQIPVLKDERAAKGSSDSPWLRLIGSAIFVLMLSAALIIGAKKYSKKKNIVGDRARIEIIHQHFLGPKKSVALIQVAGEAILIGITDTQINMIKPVALIDDEIPEAEFHGFLDEEFTVESLTAQKSRARIV